jgi:hypothetical protein
VSLQLVELCSAAGGAVFCTWRSCVPAAAGAVFPQLAISTLENVCLTIIWMAGGVNKSEILNRETQNGLKSKYFLT